VSEVSLQDAVQRVRELPTLPSILAKILATAADPDASALDLAEPISTDQSLTATLLRLVNSAYYGFYRKITSVTQAIVVLGFIEVRNIALAATTFRTLATGSKDYDRVQLWRHALATALTAQKIGKLQQLRRDGVFEAGLLHDIGKVVLDILYPQQFLAAAHKAHAERLWIQEAEMAVLGFDHAMVGGALAEHWNFPVDVADAIRFHHVPRQARHNETLAHVTAVANYIAYEGGFGESTNGKPLMLPEESVNALSLTQNVCESFAADLVKDREKIEEFLGIIRVSV
jgi:putative nucleotidyltransferase with HDIG domain